MSEPAEQGTPLGFPKEAFDARVQKLASDFMAGITRAQLSQKGQVDFGLFFHRWALAQVATIQLIMEMQHALVLELQDEVTRLKATAARAPEE